MRRTLWAVLAVASMASGVMSCGGPSTRPPSILLISIDTLRQDHVSAYGYPRATTPTLDALANEGARFDNAWSPTSWTLPAHISALTGRVPSDHGVEGQNDRLPDDVETLAQWSKEAGYATAGFVSHVYLEAKYGFDRGFDTYETRPLQSAEAVSDQAIEWLSRERREPFFLFLHYFDPHADYDPPDGSAGRFDPGVDPDVGKYTYLRRFEDPAVDVPDEILKQIVALYDAEIRYTDDHIGRVVSFLRDAGRLDDTVVVVTSDHGEEFDEHDSLGHGGTLYAEVTRVPLIVRFPGVVEGGTGVGSAVSLTDVPAVAASLAGLPVSSRLLAEDAHRVDILEELASAGAPATDRRLVLETTREGPKRFALVHDGFGYVAPSTRVRLETETDPDGRRVGVTRQQIAIPEGLFRMENDPLQLENLLEPGTVADDLSPAEIEQAAASARAGVAEYALAHARGPRLVCRGDGESVRYEGTVRFDQIVLDEPFGVGFSSADRVVTLRASAARLTSDLYGVDLDAAGAEKGIVFSPAPGSRSLQVSLLRGGGTYFDGSVPLPAPGEVVPLGDGDGCRLEGGVGGSSGGRGEVALTDEEIERLRSLGYVP